MLRRSVLLLSMLVLSVLAFFVVGLSTLAQAEVYKWINAEGNPVYGDMPPAGVDAELIRRTPAVRNTNNPSPSAPTSISEYLDQLDRQQQQAAGQSKGAAGQSGGASGQTPGAGGQSASGGQAKADKQTQQSDHKGYDSNPFDGTPSRKLSEQKDFIQQRNKQVLEQHGKGEQAQEKTLSEKKIEAQR